MMAVVFITCIVSIIVQTTQLFVVCAYEASMLEIEMIINFRVILQRDSEA